PAPRALHDEPLRRSGEEVRDDGVDGDPPPRDRDPGLAGRDEDRAQAAPPRLEVELAADGHLPDRAVGADGEDDARVRSEVLAGDRGEVGRRAAQVAKLHPAPTRELDEPRVVAEEDVEAVLDVEAALDARADQLDPLRREAPALRRDADERRRRA